MECQWDTDEISCGIFTEGLVRITVTLKEGAPTPEVQEYLDTVGQLLTVEVNSSEWQADCLAYMCDLLIWGNARFEWSNGEC